MSIPFSKLNFFSNFITSIAYFTLTGQLLYFVLNVNANVNIYFILEYMFYTVHLIMNLIIFESHDKYL